MNGRVVQTILSGLAVLLLAAMVIGMFNFSQGFTELRADVKYLTARVDQSITNNVLAHVDYEQRLRTLEFGVGEIP